MTQAESRGPRAADAAFCVHWKRRSCIAVVLGGLASVVIAGTDLLGGCALEVQSLDTEGQSANSRSQGLISWTRDAAPDHAAECNWDPWPRTGDEYQIGVCFKNAPKSGSSPDYSNDKAMAMEALEETWQKHSGIRFINHGECSNFDPGSIPWGVLPICLHYDDSRTSADLAAGDTILPDGGVVLADGGLMPFPYWYATGKSGRGPMDRFPWTYSDPACQVHIEYPPDHMSFRATVVHEMGHAIGMIHELEHPYYPTFGCEIVPGGWWYYKGGHGTFNGGCAPEPEGDCHGTVLTAALDLDSIMSCASCSRARIHDEQDWYYLSLNDRIGVGIQWPKANNPPLGSSTGFYGYGGLLLRWSSTVTTWWTLMGATNDIFADEPTWTYRPAGQSWQGKGQDYDLQASDLGAGSGELRVNYVDYWDRSWSSTTSVKVDNPKHGAVVTAAVL